MMNKFPCTKCGACCRSIEHIDFLKDYNQNGVCIHLQNNECSIYETRPLLCRIDEAYEQFFSKQMTKKEYYILNALFCNELQERKNIDEKYRIDIKQFDNHE